MDFPPPVKVSICKRQISQSGAIEIDTDFNTTNEIYM